MKRFLIAACAGVAALSPVPAGAQTTLTFSAWVPWAHPLIDALYGQWIRNVEKATHGRVTFRKLPKAVASPRASLDAVRTDQADVAFGAPPYSPKRFAAYEFTELPLLGDKAEITSVALWRTHVKFFRHKGYFAGVYLVGLNTHGPGQLFTRNHPVLKPADMKGLKIRTGGSIPRQIVEAWGAVAVRQPAPKVYELLATGVVDGVTFPWESVPSFRITKLVPYATIVPDGLYSSSFFLVINAKKWAAVPKRDKDAMAPFVGEHFARFAGKVWDMRNAVGEAAGRKAGTKIVTAPPAVIAGVKALLPKFEAAYIRGAKAVGVANGAAVLRYFHSQVRALHGK
jgi:TRAP-type C4-dicarboxylate transport system substrate-binding protein